ncbi:HVO_0234 family beta-propeller protein [Halomicrobium urmianum]|uniref:HVO_0234 family beta-propeller protein n=1 Tax=Halomicrobium urmianum TaxID=1586233 RepID=UPI001CD9D379|nr:hypothetical protein [Halomicrobium urmianum]
MPSDEDIALSEKRMYGDRREETRAYVAGRMGVTYVAVSDDQIGRFGLEEQCTARDVAGADGRLVVATDEDILVGGEEGLEPTGFGPAVAVGADPLLAADEDGRVARSTDGEWETAGTVDEVRSIDGGLVAAADGVYRVDPDGLTPLGRRDARDVAAEGPFAATGAGLFRGTEDGWDLEEGGDATVVAAETGGGRAHAVVGGDLLERPDGGERSDGSRSSSEQRSDGGEWWLADAPREGVVDVAYDEATFAVTGDGAVLVDPVTAKDGEPEWRTRSLGLTDVVGIAVP